jgi:uncharacterized protein YebE (UPF0316 family)
MEKFDWFGFDFSAFFIIFVLINILNVILSTIKSIATVKCGKIGAAIANAISHGVYAIVVVFTSTDGLGIVWKALVIAGANLFGVYIVKYLEEKNRKEKLWKIEATVDNEFVDSVHKKLKDEKIPHSYIVIGESSYTLFNTYCKTKEESRVAKNILTYYRAKYFISESKYQ